MELSRRELLVGTAAVGLPISANANVFGFFQDAPTLKVGLIGCGGRGSGALRQTLEADKGTKVHALGDLFPDRLEGCFNDLTRDLPDRTDVGDRKFSGFDAYQKVLASGVDVVILATPPGFRPIHFAAAVDAKKHIFMEKPVAVDGPGIRAVVEAAKKAKAMNLSVVAGTQRRHDVGYNEVIKRIKDGAIGKVVSMSCWWNMGGLWMNPRKPEWSDMEWQLRNWLYFAWLSGDHIVEQHVHNLDVCNWVMGGHPVKASSLGGRQVRTDPAYGHIFDHFATEYTYEDGTVLMSQCRQIDGCSSKVAEHIAGTKGTSNGGSNIQGENNYRFTGKSQNPYVLEHVRLYKSIRSNEGFNEGEQVAHSTMTAIMARMSAYSGQEVTWDQAINSTVSLAPSKYELGSIATPLVAVPGSTKGVF